MRTYVSRRLPIVIGSVIALVGITVGAAVAAFPVTDGVIHGCVNNSKGTLRVIDPDSESCKNSETAIAWNQEGPQGPTGPTGAGGEGGAISIVNGGFFPDDQTERSDQLLAMPADGTLAQLRIIRNSPQEYAQSTYTIAVNGIDTGLTCTTAVAETSCADTLHSMAVEDGDVVTVHITPGPGAQENRGAGYYVSMTFQPA